MDEEWENLVDSVLREIEPEADQRRRLRERMRDARHTGPLHAALACGGDPRAIAKVLRHLAAELV